MSKSRIVEKPFGMVDETVAEENAEPKRQVKVTGAKWLIVRDAIDGDEVDRIEMGTVGELVQNDGPWTCCDWGKVVGWSKTQYLEFL